MKGPAAIRELQVFCDLPAEAAIREAAAFFTERGLKITRQDAHSARTPRPNSRSSALDAQRDRPARRATQRKATTPLATGELGAADAAGQPGHSARCRCGGRGHRSGGRRQVPRLADGGRTRRSRGRGGGAGRALALAQCSRGGCGYSQRAQRVHRARLGPSARLPCAPTGVGAECHLPRSSSASKSSGTAGRTSPAKRSRKTSEAGRGVRPSLASG